MSALPGPRPTPREGLERATLLVPVLVVALVAVAVGVLGGLVAGLSTLAGGVGTVVLLAATPAVLGPLVSSAPHSALLSALAFYLLKVTVLSAALVALGSETGRRAIEAPALGAGVVLGVLAYTSALVVATVRARRLTYEPVPGPAAGQAPDQAPGPAPDRGPEQASEQAPPLDSEQG